METTEKFSIDDYETFLHTRTSLCNGTIAMYRFAVKKFVKEYNNLENLEFYNEFLLKYAIKKRSTLYYSALKHLVRFWIKDKSKRNRMLKVLLKPQDTTPKRKRKYLSYQERLRVIKQIENYKHKILARAQFYTGARISELLTLKKGDISFEPYCYAPNKYRLVMLLTITGKGNKKNPIWIHNQQLADEIASYTLNKNIDVEYYFLWRELSRKMDIVIDVKTNYHWYWQDLKQALEKCGYKKEDWASHDFRRNSGTDVWETSKDPLTVQRFLRHKRFDTTLRYLENAGAQTKETMNKLNEMYSK
jgi:integrase